MPEQKRSREIGEKEVEVKEFADVGLENEDFEDKQKKGREIDKGDRHGKRPAQKPKYKDMNRESIRASM